METEDESDILEQWASRLLAQGWHVGRWRRTIQGPLGLKNQKDFKQEEKEPGALVLIEKTWNLYFYKDPHPCIVVCFSWSVWVGF